MDVHIIGRLVRVVSISFNNRSLEEIVSLVDFEGSKGADIIVLPETCRGEKSEPETLQGITITAIASLAEKHCTYIVCPIYRKDEQTDRINSAVLIDREGNVACVYDKVFPYWEEFKLDPPVEVGLKINVYDCDFGRLGMAVCFDANFPEVWKILEEQGAELVIWPSAYSAGITLQAHAINNNYYIVTSTLLGDCIVYDITGKEILYEKSEEINVTRVTLDLDRCIFHEDYNLEKRDRLLQEHGNDVQQEVLMEREKWFVLTAISPDISARKLARTYDMEELRDYRNRSRRQLDKMRGFSFEEKNERWKQC